MSLIFVSFRQFLKEKGKGYTEKLLQSLKMQIELQDQSLNSTRDLKQVCPQICGLLSDRIMYSNGWTKNFPFDQI